MKLATTNLSNGIEMPLLGLGTYPMMGEQLNNAVSSAYEVGYRLIDTADNYYNEEDLGHSLQSMYNKIGAKRSDMFLVTKVSDELYHPNSIGGGYNRGIYFWKTSPIMHKQNAVHEIVSMKLNNSLKYLKTGYIDLYLMHWPYPDFFQEIWYEMEQLYKVGKVRAIGVCNCRERHLEMLNDSEIFPMVNQFETSPLNTKSSLVDYCQGKEVKVMVYSPLMHLRRKGHNEYHSYLDELCAKYNRSREQISLRYNLQRGLISIPKSSHRERLHSNALIFDFHLEETEMQALSSFNIDMQTLPESKSCPGI